MASARDFGDESSPANESHLRFVGRHQGDRIHVHFAEKYFEEVYYDFGFENAGEKIVHVF